MHKASDAGHVKTVKYLIKIGAQIEAKDKDEVTPLHKAADKGHLEIVQCLIDHGAQTKVKDKKSST